ncbi:MAG: hypothetical protein ACRDGP_09190 [Actinomycetota bacterium]
MLDPDRADIIDNEGAFVAGQIQPVPKGNLLCELSLATKVEQAHVDAKPVRARELLDRLNPVERDLGEQPAHPA